MIAVLGGGITGLTAAYYLKQKGIDFRLIESSNRLGGKIYTLQEKGYTMEKGPNTVLINNQEILQLLKDLKLYDERIEPRAKAIKNRFVIKNGKIEAIPNSMSTIFSSNLFLFNTLSNLIAEPFRKKRISTEDESLADFCRRRFGKQIYEDLITPFVSGIYAGDPEKMSVNHTLSILKQAENRSGSVIKGMMKLMKERKKEPSFQDLPKQKIFTLGQGLQQLTQTISSKIAVDVLLKAKIKEISQNKNGNYELWYEQNGESHRLEAEKVISCIPAKPTALLLQNLDDTTSAALKKINYVSTGVMHFGFKEDQLSFKKDAFGILNRRQEKFPFLGILFNSRFFPHTAPEGYELITVIFGGYEQKELLQEDENTIKTILLKNLKQVIGLEGKVHFSHLTKWQTAIPQYELGYDAIKSQIEVFRQEHPNYYLAGNYYGGVSVSDCIKNAVNIVKTI